MTATIDRAIAVASLVLVACGADAVAQSGARPVRVQAQVVGLDGAPIAGAGLVWADVDRLTTEQVLQRPLARSDTQGRLVVALPPAPAARLSRYRVVVVAPGRTSIELAVPGVPAGGTKGDPLQVDLGRIILRRGIAIRGLCRSVDGRPVVGARVVATDVFRARHLQIRFPDTCRSWATTDREGRFTLVGVPPRGVSVTVRAAGYADADVQYDNQYSPLVVHLHPAGATTGTVVDPGGRPVAGAEVQARFEMSRSTVVVRADGGGRYQIPLRHPGRYRLGAGYGDGDDRCLWSGVLDGPRQDLQLVAPAPRRRVQVRARAADGSPLSAFRGVLVWAAPDHRRSDRSSLESVFAASARRCDAGGRLVLPGPVPGGPVTGALLIRAAGHAARVVPVVDWDAGASLTLDVRLAPESSIAGVVRDAAGRPVANAAVWLEDIDYTRVRSRGLGARTSLADLARSDTLRTDAQGRFRFGSLGAGTYFLNAAVPGGPPSGITTVRLDRSAHRRGLVLTVPPGATLDGRVVGAPVQPGWLVCETPRPAQAAVQIFLPTSLPTAPADPDPTAAVAVAPDGRFRITRLAPGQRWFALLIPYPLGTLEIPLGQLTVRDGRIRHDFSIANERPGQLVGELTWTGPRLPPGRLLALAMGVDGPPVAMVSPAGPGHHGVRVLVDRAGRFAMPVREGRYILRVVDLATGVTLYQGQQSVRVPAGGRARAVIPVQSALLEVTLRPARAGGRVLATRLEVDTGFPRRVHNPGQVFIAPGNQAFDSGVGVALQPGQDRLSLVVPCRRLTLRVWGEAHRLDPGRAGQAAEPLASRAVEPGPDAANRVTIPVADAGS